MRRFPFNRSNSGRPIYFNRGVGYRFVCMAFSGFFCLFITADGTIDLDNLSAAAREQLTMVLQLMGEEK